jgi:ribulose-phosphate 3-epimerase
MIHEAGAAAGVAINPATEVGALAEIGGDIDLALCMTVNPGWGGQPFISHSLDKLPRIRAIVGEQAAVEVDGGIDPKTAPACRGAGAGVFVAGSAIFSEPDPAAAYAAITAALADVPRR